MRLNIQDLKEIMELMKVNEVEELIINEGRESLELRKKGAFTANNAPAVISNMPIMPTAIPTTGQIVAQESIPTSNETNETNNDNYYEIIAPLVGTFYRSPSPDTDVFVSVGDTIKKGDTLCIVEAMKNMNEIESDVNGVIKEICIEDSTLVEYNQVLFKIEKA